MYRVRSNLKGMLIGVMILGGSWDLVSRVISTLIRVISRYNYGYLTCNPTYYVP